MIMDTLSVGFTNENSIFEFIATSIVQFNDETLNNFPPIIDYRNIENRSYILLFLDNVEAQQLIYP